jgi:hypothetical protein
LGIIPIEVYLDSCPYHEPSTYPRESIQIIFNIVTKDRKALRETNIRGWRLGTSSSKEGSGE